MFDVGEYEDETYNPIVTYLGKLAY